VKVFRVVPHRLAPAIALVLAAAVPGAAAPGPAAAPPAGSAGIGDPYFPLDGNGGIDVLHYDIRDRYDLRTRRLAGTTTLSIRATQTLDRFNLDLLLPVRQVRVDGARARHSKPNRHELQITPARPIAAGTRFTVVVGYAGEPGPIGYAGERNWLASRHEVVAMNQPHMAPWWFPSNDHPLDKAGYDIRITSGAARDVLANGTQVGRTRHGRLATTHWRSREPMASYLAFFAVGDFQVKRGRTGGIPWLLAVSERLPERLRVSSMQTLRSSGPITVWLQKELGDYPFGSTGGLVTSLDPGFALENQTRPTYPALDVRNRPVVVHELAHQWFGDSVSVHGWRDIWLNEGFATYMEWRYDEAHGGLSTRRWLHDTYDRYLGSSTFWDVRVDDPGAQRIFESAVYERGGMTLAALREVIGTADLLRLLRAWVAQHRFRHGTTQQFTDLAEQVSGRQLDGFFDAWLRADEPPARTAANGLG
jgi:aminopeptidase N